MIRLKVAESYSKLFLETERPQPLSDKKIDSLISEVLTGKVDRDISDNIYDYFKTEFINWLENSKLNHLKGLDDYKRLDICTGCTQYIDTIYMNGPVQTLENDYRYHARLQKSFFRNVGNLLENIPLIIAMPFPSIGAPHDHMESILEECLSKNIDVHIDGAWVTCCRDIEFDFTHPAIKSFAISLSKGLGLGWNRVALRWYRKDVNDAITIMNDFHMINRANIIIARHFLKNLQPDHLWNAHKDRYYKICNDFDLEPTKSIYLAIKDNHPVGITPLIRYLEEND